MIVLSGASSTGKTTLATDWCEKHKEYYHVKEIARDLMKNKSITRENLKTFMDSENKHKFFDFQQLIFEKQNSIETDLILNNSSFIADRGPDPLVFVERHIDHASALKLADSYAAKMCLQRYSSKNCVVIILCPLDKIEDDSVRIVPTREEQIQYIECLKRILQEMQISYQFCDRTDRTERLHWLETIVSSMKYV